MLRRTLQMATSLVCLGLAGVVSLAQAEEPHSIAIEQGSGRLLKLTGQANNVYAADPKVAEVRPASADTLFVFGVSPGHTTVVATNAAGAAVGTYAIDVTEAGFPARSAERLIGRSLHNSEVRVEPREHGVALDGFAGSPAEAQEAVAIAHSEIGKDDLVDNRLRVQGSIQVNLHVRIAEMSRTLTRELGVSWQSVNALGTQAVVGLSSVNPVAFAGANSLGFLSRANLGGRSATLDTIIDALSQDQLVKTLAEPNLTTLSGEPASFLVGGEFPIPVADQNNSISVIFKRYGISLDFVPTVLSSGQISLHVRPEVSALSNQGAVSLSAGNSAIQIPALTVRRAETTVELGSGQSFAIAGLLQDNAADGASGLPFLSNLPVLGALFRSDSFQHNETELVIVVTPYIVRPVDNLASLTLPTDAYRPPNDIERLLWLKQQASSTAGARNARPYVPGDAGFLVE